MIHEKYEQIKFSPCVRRFITSFPFVLMASIDLFYAALCMVPHHAKRAARKQAAR